MGYSMITIFRHPDQTQQEQITMARVLAVLQILPYMEAYKLWHTHAFLVKQKRFV